MNVEKQLLSLIKASQALTSTRDLDEVLKLLIKEVLDVFDWADASVLFLYDANSDKLIAKSALGFDMDYLKQVALRPNEGMSGKTFQLKQAQLFTSETDTSRGMSDLTQKNMEYYRKALGGKEILPSSTICAPLITHGECYGVLTIDSFSEEVEFTHSNLRILQTFANQAMIAIENATLISQNNRSNHIHRELTKVYMSHQNLSEITKTLSELVNRAVGVYNDFFDLISYSSDSVKKISEVLSKEGFLGEKNLVHRPVVVEKVIYHVYFFPIHIKANTSGTLIVIADVDGTGQALDSLDMFAIEQATTVFALELQSLYQQLSNEFIQEGRIMEQLLEGTSEGEQVLRKNGLYQKHSQYVVLTLEIAEEEASHTQMKKQSFSRLLQRLLDQSAMKTLVYEKAQHYSILFILEESLSVEVVQQKISELVGKLRGRIPFNILAGLGREFSKLEEIHSSLKDSQMCIKFLKQTGGHNRAVLTNQDLGVHRLFLDMERPELENYWKMKLRSVHEYDQLNGTELLPTLEWYLFFSQNVRKTAEVMFVHENTIKYRINSVRKVLEIDEWTGDVLLDIYLALKIYNYLGEPRLSN